jgi:thioredoxin reductase (NADPH)
MIETDILIIGAGPCGLFTVFEAGLLKLRCHLIDSLPQAGGQLTEIYPKKPIYDIPGFPEVMAGDLIEHLMNQAAPFKPGFTLGERAESFEKTDDGKFIVTTSKGTKHKAPVVAIAGGLGCFEPRKPPISNINQFEENGIEYIVRDPEFYRGKKVIISGGGDSALDWSIFLAEGLAEHVTLVHRSTSFRGHLDSVQKVMDMSAAGKMKLITNGEVIGVHGSEKLNEVEVAINGQDENLLIHTDHWLPLFGLSPKLGPLSEWGLQIDKNSIEVNTFDYSTNVEGIYAIGDINTYPGKLKLILCGFHEATLMVQSAFKRIYPNKNYVLKYTTVNGVNGFE